MMPGLSLALGGPPPPRSFMPAEDLLKVAPVRAEADYDVYSSDSVVRFSRSRPTFSTRPQFGEYGRKDGRFRPSFFKLRR
jgi:hypothetical protein